MIKDERSIVASPEADLRRVALGIATDAIEANRPDRLLERRFELCDRRLVVNGELYDLGGLDDVYVVGGGKGSQLLVDAVLDRLEDVTEAIIAEKRGQAVAGDEDRSVFEASHPVPDESSYAAAAAVSDLAKRTAEDDLVICCITGGISALLTLPDEVSIDDVAATTELLLNSGASVDDLNTIRKHLSQIKGGRLAQEFAPSKVISLIVVDEIGGGPWGPTVPDATTFEDAIDVLKRNGCWDETPAPVRERLLAGVRGEVEETPTADEFEPLPVQNVTIATADDLCTAAVEAAKDRGYESTVLSTMIEGESSEIGIAHAGIAKEIAEQGRPLEPPCAIVSGGETTVTVTNPDGSGGPNQESALGFAENASGWEGIVGAFVDSDGTDGPTDVAGGIADGGTAARAERLGLDVQSALARNDSTLLLSELDDAIRFEGPGVNLMDLRVVVVGAEADDDGP